MFVPFEQRPPIEDMDAQAIHHELVSDAVSGYFTPIQRFTDGCFRIAALRKIDADTAYNDVRTAAIQLGAVGMLMGEMH